MDDPSARRLIARPWAMLTTARARLPDAARQILRLSLLLVTFVAFTTLVERLTHLPTAAYEQTSPSIELVQRVGWLATFVLISATAVLAHLGRLLAPWDALQLGRELRLFVVLLGVGIAWPLVTAGHNFYFDQGYLADKVLLVALVPLTWWRPVFVFPLTVVAYLLLWQLGEPSLGGSIFAHKLQVLRPLNLFAAAFFLFAVTGDRRTNGFIVLLCCFVATAYWLPAVAKLKLTWLSDERLYLLPLSAYAHGWLAFLSPEQIIEVSRRIMPIDAAMRMFVIAVEALCLVFLWRRWLSLILLAAVVVFHLGVFVLYGFFFWTWILVDVALFLLLVKLDGQAARCVFNRPYFVASVVLIAIGGAWAKPPQLGWYDTPLTYTYRVLAVAENGETELIHPKFFAPYDDVMTMASFAYLAPTRAVLVGPYGVTGDRQTFDALMQARNAADVFAVEGGSGLIRYDSVRAERLKEFLQRYVANRAKHGEAGGSLLRAPQQFWSFRGTYPDVDQIHALAVVEVTSFFDGARLTDIRTRELMRIPVPRPPAQ